MILEIITILCGAILSYIIYAVVQVYLIENYAEEIFKTQKPPITLKGYFVELYKSVNEKLLEDMIDLQLKVELTCGFKSPMIKEFISIINNELYMVGVLEYWAEYESKIYFQKNWNGIPIDDLNTHNKELNEIKSFIILPMCYIPTFGEKEICFINEEYKKSFELFLSEYNIEYDFKIKIK